MMRAIRAVLGAIILFLDRLFAPKSLERPPAEQLKVDQQTSKLSIYEFEACPFCVKVRRAVKRLGLRIEYRNVQKNEQYKNELLAGGGEYQVPCLRITKDDGSIQWMYESDEIIKFLTSRFAT